MKKIHLTLIAAMVSSLTAFGQQVDQISGSFATKVKYASTSNVYPMDSCRVNYTYKTVMGSPGYLANVVWSSRNEFTYNGTKVTLNDVKNYPDLLRRFKSIAPTNAKLTFTLLFYSDALKGYIASAKSSMSIDYLEAAGVNYGPMIQKNGTWRETFSDVVIGKQDKSKIGTVIADATVDEWIKKENIRSGKLDPNPSVRGYGAAIRKAFSYSSKIEVVDVNVKLEWPTSTMSYLVSELNRIDKISAKLADNDSVSASALYFENRTSIPVVRPTSIDFWNSSVPSYSLVESYMNNAEDAYKKADYNTASVYYEKALSIDSSLTYAKNRIKKINQYDAFKNVRNVGDMDLVYVEGSKNMKSFYMGKTEVTQSQWRRVMGTPAPNASDCRTCPVTNITWADASEFVKRLSDQTGMKYRLPSVEQWEYAANGGKYAASTQFSGSDNIDDVAWTVYNSEESIHPVAQKTANDLGVYDMTGNVSEWVSNKYDAKTRLVKGGSWADDAANCVNDKTQKFDVNYKSKTVGFRVCQDE